MTRRLQFNRILLTAGLGATSCATPVVLTRDFPKTITVDKEVVRSEIIADTARNRFSKSFEEADRAFNEMYNEDINK